MPRFPTAILEDAVRVVEGMMQHSSREENICAGVDAQACCRTTRCFGVCDRMLVGIAILTIVRTSEVLAGEQVPPTVSAAKPDFSIAREFTPASAFVLPLPSSYQAVPSSYHAVDLPVFNPFSSAELPPPGHSL